MSDPSDQKDRKDLPGAGTIERKTPPAALDYTADSTRRVLVAVESAAAALGEMRVPIPAGSRVAVSDDADGVGRSLALRLQQVGLTPVLLSASRIDASQLAGLAGLILISGRRSFSEVHELTIDLAGLRHSFQVARAAAPSLRNAGAAGGAIFATVSRLDGAFGMAAADGDPSSGGLAGLAKTAAHEWPEVRCRALDVDGVWNDAEAVSEAIFAELCRAEAPLEVGLSADARYELQLHIQDSTGNQDVDADSARLAPGDVVVVTGGARGVTAECAVALARALRPTLILVGRSEIANEPQWLQGLSDPVAIKRALLANAFSAEVTATPAMVQRAFEQVMAQREVVASLARIRDAGAPVHYRVADVRDARQVGQLLEDVRRTIGPVRGIVHGSGVIADARIDRKTDEQFNRVLETKALGLENLVRASAGDALRLFALFSSVSGRYGREGQVDYAMANEVLNKTADWLRRRRRECRVVSIGWGPWAGGMVNESLKKEFAKLGVGLVPLIEGAQAFVNEVRAQLDAPTEILIGGTFPAPDAGAQSAPEAELPDGGRVPALGTMTRPSEPFTIYSTDDEMRDHVVGGRPVAALARMIDWMAQAARGLREVVFVGLRDCRVFRPISFEQLSRQVRVRRGPLQWRDGVLTCAICVESRTVGEEFVPAAAAVLRMAASPVGPLRKARFVRGSSRSLEARQIYAPVLFHGQTWQVIERVDHIGANDLFASLKPAPTTQPLAARDGVGTRLLDAALQLGLIFAHLECDSAALPSAIGSMDVHAADWVQQCVAMRLEIEQRTDHRLRGVVQLLDASDHVLATLHDVNWTMDRALREAFALTAEAAV